MSFMTDCLNYDIRTSGCCGKPKKTSEVCKKKKKQLRKGDCDNCEFYMRKLTKDNK